jgi:hypothetical protein
LNGRHASSPHTGISFLLALPDVENPKLDKVAVPSPDLENSETGNIVRRTEAGKGSLWETRKTMNTIVRKRSAWAFYGLPLVDIAYGPDPERGERHGTARGVIAVGDRAHGWIALGGSARGYIALGGKARGLIALGGQASGIVALGGIAAGLIALGGIACGAVAVGGLAAGIVAVGGRSTGAFSLDRRGRR